MKASSLNNKVFSCWTEATIARDEGDTQNRQHENGYWEKNGRSSLMNEIVMKTLTLLVLAKIEEKSDAPVTNALNYAYSTSGRGLCAELCKKRKGIAFADFFLGTSHHLPASLSAGWNYARTRGNAIISIS